MKPTFTGEIQLAGWSESHNSGCKVTFWLQSPDDLEPFRALTVRKGNTAGHRFMAALVEIGDDEQPVQEAKPKGGPLSQAAAMLDNNDTFRKYAFVRDFPSVREFILDRCGISSRIELDNNHEAARRFHQMMRNFNQEMGT